MERNPIYIIEIFDEISNKNRLSIIEELEKILNQKIKIYDFENYIFESDFSKEMIHMYHKEIEYSSIGR